jgi:hypothetical protein
MILLVKIGINKQKLFPTSDLLFIFQDFKSVSLTKSSILEEDIDKDISEHLGLCSFNVHAIFVQLH